MAIVGDLLLWFKDYLTNRKQRLVINGKESSWKTVNAGVRQRSILSPSLFPMFINDIVDEVNCPIKLYADNISIYAIVDKPLITSLSLNSNLQKVQNWSNRWLVNFNPKKIESMIISRKVEPQFHPPLYFNNVPITNVATHTLLGLTFSNDGSWTTHVNEIMTKVSSRLNIIRKLKFKVDRKSLVHNCTSVMSALF